MPFVLWLLRRFFRGRLALAGVLVLLAMLACAAGGAHLTPFDADDQDILARLLPPLSAGDGGIHWLGTDALGRDVLSRLIVGARVSLLVGVLAMAVSACVGVSLGLIAGFEDRYLGRLLMMLTDMQLAIPFLVLALAVVAVLGNSLFNLVLVLGLTNWVQYVRVVRAECLMLRDREFVQAARAIGASAPRIVLRHLLPQILPSVVVISSLLVARMILFEASLSYLGLGVPADIPTWGAMIAEGRDYVSSAWWVVAMPGFALFATVVAVNLVGDRLRDLLDPRLNPLEG
jgi:peptide/nickel transport system permease protein